MKQEFARFRDTPGVFAKAALHYPSDPQWFLRKVGRSIDALAADPEFERFREALAVLLRHLHFPRHRDRVEQRSHLFRLQHRRDANLAAEPRTFDEHCRVIGNDLFNHQPVEQAA